METCFIMEEKKVSKPEFFLFYYFGWKKLLKKNTYLKENMCLLKIPLPEFTKEEKKKRYFLKVMRYLKKKNVKKLYINHIQDNQLKCILKKEFPVFYGKELFSAYFSDILKFFITKKGYRSESCEIIFISNYPKVVREYILQCYKNVKNISIFTTNGTLFQALIDEFREKYGMFIQKKGKNDKVKKHNKIYVNLDAERIVDSAFFKDANILDIYDIYKNAINEILFSYKIKDNSFLKENKIVKNIPFTEYYAKALCKEKDGKKMIDFLKEKHYKIVNIKKL